MALAGFAAMFFLGMLAGVRLSKRERGAEAHRSRHPIGATLPSDAPAVLLDALVEQVDVDLQLVVLSVEEDQGVKMGDLFTIYREYRFVGRVCVIKLYGCAARIVEMSADHPHRRLGDCAALTPRHSSDTILLENKMAITARPCRPEEIRGPYARCPPMPGARAVRVKNPPVMLASASCWSFCCPA